MRFVKLCCVLVVPVVSGALLLTQPRNAAGEVTITKCKMVDKTNGGEVPRSGMPGPFMADAYHVVEFRGEATCSCSAADLTYTWNLGDGHSAEGASLSYVYHFAGAGNRSPTLTVFCKTCKSRAMAGGLSLYVISGIKVAQIGDIMDPTDNGRLCFDARRGVRAVAEPMGVGGSDKIDWTLVVYGDSINLANTATGQLGPIPAWPPSNMFWGAMTLFISIDGPLVAGQEGEMIVTGPASYISNDKPVKVFYDETGFQHPGGSTPNWYYYWRGTSASYESYDYDSGIPAGQTRFENGAWRCFIGPGAHLTAAGGCWNNAAGIDYFANICRHEARHKWDMIANWGASNPRDPNHDADGDYLHDDVEANLIPGHPYQKTNATTYSDTFGYLPPPPGRPLRDDEDYCLRREPAWTNESARSEDWAHPGQQWP